jgi:hypothetical protein
MAVDRLGTGTAPSADAVWIRRPGHRAAERIAFVNAYAFSASVQQRLKSKHPELTADGLALVEAAARQWFRIVASQPRSELSMPSRLVDDLWHEFMLHTRDYAAFCKAAFGRFLHHQPETAMSPKRAAANHSKQLVLTLRLTQADEHCPPTDLPLLFRVDREAGLKDYRKYLADCGGRGQCYSMPNTTCLQHITGLGKPIRLNTRSSAGSPAYGGGTGGYGVTTGRRRRHGRPRRRWQLQRRTMTTAVPPRT